MKRNYLLVSLLAIAVMFTGCSQDEEIISTSTSKTYEASVFASKEDISEITEDGVNLGTRALFVGGNTARFATLWDKNDVVQVYKDGNQVGTLSLNDENNEQYQGTKDAYLSGTLTGNFAVGDNLDLYLPSKERSYTGQKGTINHLSANYSYQMKTVQIASVNGTKITLKKANMNHRQAYIRFVLMDQNGNRLHPSELTITATGENKLITAVAEDGATMTYGDNIVITPEMDNGEYPDELFVALLNQGYNESTFTNGSVNYSLTAVVDGITYVFPGPNEELDADGANGKQKPIKVNPTIGGLTKVARKLTMAESTMTMASQMKILQGTKKIRTPKVTVGSTDVTKQCTFTYTSDDYSVAWVNSKTGEVTAVGTPGSTATITVTSSAPYVASTTYTVTVTAPVPATADNYVDLNLPSGTKWAKMNVGATSETDFGTYFAWGETDGYTDEDNYSKDSFSFLLATHKYQDNGTYFKYTSTDGKTILDPEDDAATQNWGADWCTPTREDLLELFEVCWQKSGYTWTWCDGETTKYNNVAGVEGWQITYNATGATLFLPMSGRINDEGLIPEAGWYWMSSKNGNTAARNLTFVDRNTFNTWGTAVRWVGCSIRPVTKPSN